MTVAPSPDSAIAAYRTPGVSGVSVLVEPDYFGGGIQLFSQFRSQLEVPMLFKDFIVSEEQLEAASTIGADAVLLIAKLLSSDSLDALIEESVRTGLEPLVELHDEADIRKFRELRAADAVKVIGLNSRDFSIMRTNLERIIALRHALPDDKVIIAESGIGSADDVKRLRDFDGVLVGSLLMRALDVKQQVAELVAACRGAKA
jgi:indole-3-glycerol phosphate synthase